MKRVIALVLTLSIAMTLFAFNVFAADYQTKAIQTGATTVNGVTIATQIVEMAAHIESQPIYQGAAVVPFLYTTIITNNTDQNKLVSGIKVAARYQNLGTRYLANIDNMSPDMIMSISTLAGTGWFDILPSSTFSVENATLIPAHRSLYCVAVVYMDCEYMYSNTNQTYVPVLPAFEGDAYVRLTDVLDGSGYDFFDPGTSGSADVTAITQLLTDYISGNSTDDFITYLNNLNNNTNTIIARLNTIISSLNSWTGTTPVYSPWQSYQTSGTMTTSQAPSFSESWCTLYAMPSFEFSEDFEKLTNSTSYFNYSTVIPVQLSYYYYLNDDDPAEVFESFYIRNVIKASNGYSIVGGEIHSNFASIARWSTSNGNYNLQIFPDLDVIKPGEAFILTYNFYIVYSDTNWTYWMTGNLQYDAPNGATPQDYSDLETESDKIGAASDAIHQQEEVWYQQNKQAMESVGLSNFQYTQQQYNGILGVTFQFEQLWNALGSWTLVYIFTLLLSLATFILRHRPTTKMQQRMEEGQIRAEASHQSRLANKKSDYRIYYDRLRRK